MFNVSFSFLSLFPRPTVIGDISRTHCISYRKRQTTFWPFFHDIMTSMYTIQRSYISSNVTIFGCAFAFCNKFGFKYAHTFGKITRRTHTALAHAQLTSAAHAPHSCPALSVRRVVVFYRATSNYKSSRYFAGLKK